VEGDVLAGGGAVSLTVKHPGCGGLRCERSSRDCPECGNAEGMRHDPWDGWSCAICDWEENPL
jgi:hypothetical protein